MKFLHKIKLIFKNFLDLLIKLVKFTKLVFKTYDKVTVDFVNQYSRQII